MAYASSTRALPAYEDSLNIKEWLKKFPIELEDEWSEKYSEESPRKQSPVSLQKAALRRFSRKRLWMPES